MKSIVAVSLLLFLSACAAGPVYVAKNESESFKTAYDDPQLQKLHGQNEALLKNIYSRFNKAQVNTPKQAIGMTFVQDQNNRKHPYFMIGIRPSEVYFNVNATTPSQRFSQVLNAYFPKYLNFIRKEDFEKNGVEGLDLAIYWPVRDYSQCNTYGGFIEYIHVYFTKNDVQDILDGRRTFFDVAKSCEVITSLNLEPAKSVKPVF